MFAVFAESGLQDWQTGRNDQMQTNSSEKLFRTIYIALHGASHLRTVCTDTESPAPDQC